MSASVRRETMGRWLMAGAFVAGPIAFGGFFFAMRAPDRSVGVFVETPRATYALSAYSPAGRPDVEGSDAPAVLPERGLVSFFVVGLPMPASGPSAKVYALVVDAADGSFKSDRVPIPAAVTRANATSYRVMAPHLDAWAPGQPAFMLYEKVAATHAGSRAGLEAAIGLDVEDASGGHRLYTVRVGPQ
jgi:hypothetical protein